MSFDLHMHPVAPVYVHAYIHTYTNIRKVCFKDLHPQIKCGVVLSAYGEVSFPPSSLVFLSPRSSENLSAEALPCVCPQALGSVAAPPAWVTNGLARWSSLTLTSQAVLGKLVLDIRPKASDGSQQLCRKATLYGSCWVPVLGCLLPFLRYSQSSMCMDRAQPAARCLMGQLLFSRHCLSAAVEGFRL